MGYFRESEPYNRDYCRVGDTSTDGKTPSLELTHQRDGDVIVRVVNEDASGSFSSPQVEFCATGAGGGRSFHTLNALRDLITAVDGDNDGVPAETAPQSAAINPETVERVEDMSCWGKLQLTAKDNGEILVSVSGRDSGRAGLATVLFSSAAIGAGKRCSPKTVIALLAVMVAMKLDNERYPIEGAPSPRYP